jgi:DNA repair protein RadA/Sms
MVEQPKNSVPSRSDSRGARKTEPRRLTEVSSDGEGRFKTGLGELDRVLGGGAVKGSLVLIGGSPGIGKSTLLLQICGRLCRDSRVLYVSGEESERQLKMRSERLKVNSDELFVFCETALSEVLTAVESIKPEILIVDSIQTLASDDNQSPPGSVTQVKSCTMELMKLAKFSGITVFVIGHVNKDGAIAGPKVLEHMVDCVLYFEGDKNSSYRILRAAKNRYGSTNEIGMFDMRDDGLAEIKNPSEMLLSGRPKNAPGTCVACVMEGSRPILSELQALLAPTSFGVPRRNTNGFDYNRAMLLLAVLEKRCGIMTGNCDAYINVIGGLSIEEPAADLPMLLATVSSIWDKPVGADLAAIGEVGLSGELRSVSYIEQRINEVRRLGFKRCIIPAHGTDRMRIPDGLNLLKAGNVTEAIKLAFGVS